MDYVVTKGLQKTGYKHFKEWNDSYQGTVNADLLVMGSSRAWTIISPQVLDSVLELNSYNLGINGHNFYLQKIKLDTYCKNNEPPKYIIHSLDTKTLKRREDLYDYQQFLPYLSDGNIKAATKNYEGLGKADYSVPFFRYRKDHDLIKIGVLEMLKLKQHKNNKYKGFYAYDREWSENSMQFLKDNYPNHVKIHKPSVDDFEDYIVDLNKKGIQLFFVYPPYYIEAQDLTSNKDSILNYYVEIAEKHNIPFWDYSNDTLSYQKELFFDFHHVNKSGTKIFTEDLANKISVYLKTDS